MATASYKVVLLGEGKYKYDDITVLDMTFLMFRLCWKGLGSRKLQCKYSDFPIFRSFSISLPRVTLTKRCVWNPCVQSSIVLRYVEDKFHSGHLTTLQVGRPRVQASIGVRTRVLV